MKIKQITESAGGTTAGAIATVAGPIGIPQKRSGSIFKGKKTKKKFYEGKMKDLEYDLEHMNPNEFKKKYKKTKDEVRKSLKEEEIKEQDLIVVPGMRKSKDTSFIPHEKDRRDHEVEMARSEVYAAAKDAMRIFKLLKNRTEDEGLMGWQQSYITLASDYLNSVADSLEYQMNMYEMTGGVIAGGMSNAEESKINELKSSTINDYISKSSAAVRGGRKELPKKVPSWKVAAGKVNPDSVMGKYAKVKAGDLQGVAEGLGKNLVYISKDKVKDFEDWMESEGLETAVPTQDKGLYVVYDYSNADHISKVYADEWNEKEGMAEANFGGMPYDRLQGLQDPRGHKPLGQNFSGSQSKEILKVGTVVRVPHKGKMVPGKIIRYDSGKGGESPAYVVDIGEYESKIVPVHNMKQGVAEGRYGRYYDPMGDERREQDAMAADRRRFKHDELSAELAGEEEAARRANEGPWYIRINGKIVKDKNKEPYVFSTFTAAQKAVHTMKEKAWNQGKEFSYVRTPTDKTDEGRIDNYTTKMDDEGNLVKVYPPSGPKSQKALIKSLVRNFGSSHIGKRGESPKGDKVGKGANLKGSTVAKLSGGMSKVHEEKCPHCGGEMVSEELINEKKDACYYKVKSRYKVWPSAYASGALVKCRKKGSKNWGKSKK